MVVLFISMLLRLMDNSSSDVISSMGSKLEDSWEYHCIVTSCVV